MEEIKKQNAFIYKTKKIIKMYYKPFLISFFSVLFVTVLGSLLVNTNSAWFQGLILPKFYPPSFLFSVIWSILYFLIFIGLFLVLQNKPSKQLIWLYAINGFLNIVWNLVFFRLNSLVFGVLVLGILILFAYFLLKELYKTNKTSFYLTLPYFVWLLYAFLLNYSIYFLN